MIRVFKVSLELDLNNPEEPFKVYLQDAVDRRQIDYQKGSIRALEKALENISEGHQILSVAERYMGKRVQSYRKYYEYIVVAKKL